MSKEGSALTRSIASAGSRSTAEFQVFLTLLASTNERNGIISKDDDGIRELSLFRDPQRSPYSGDKSSCLFQPVQRLVVTLYLYLICCPTCRRFRDEIGLLQICLMTPLTIVYITHASQSHELEQCAIDLPGQALLHDIRGSSTLIRLPCPIKAS